MSLSYGILFQVELSHYYYKDKIDKSIDIEPTQACMRSINSQSLILKKTPSGLIVHYPIKNDHSDRKYPLVPIQQNAKFSFVLRSKDPLFYIYSDLTLETQPNKMYHLHNLNNNIQNGERLLTSDKRSEFLTKEDQIEVKPPEFEYSIQSPKPIAKLSIVNIDGNKVLEPTVKHDSRYYIDLIGYPEDKYGIIVDGEFKEYFYTSTLNRPYYFGIIDIYNNDSVSSEYKYSDHNQKISSKTYKIKIAARYSFWRYNIVFRGNTTIHPEKLSLTTSDDTIGFSYSGLKSLPDGSSAITFTSNSEIPFQDNSPIALYLKKTGSNSSDADEIFNLPIAAPNSFNFDPIENKPFADVYVYL